MGMHEARIGLLLAGASARGINGSTLHRARNELEYASQRQGGREGQNFWYPEKGWKLKVGDKEFETLKPWSVIFRV